ncbi:MAG TPA: M55 family metallopeptidase [Candidatus Limnocylindrales bacterium]|nr:M55 family metallopeptidase [Candidatus Limnocylindrales bacterium]
MRVYISVDMEGIAGVSHPRPTGRDDSEYPRNVALMVGEANAAIAGAFDGGADAVVVNDSHGDMHNLPPADLDPRASLVQGSKPYSMVEAAADGRFDLALFVGYHARAGHPTGTIAHTYTGKPTLTLLGGRPVPEAGMNALYLGALAIPVGLVAGDDALAAEMADWLPWAEAVVVKRGISTFAAESVHPTEACARIRAASERAVRRITGPAGDAAPLRPLRLDPPIEVGIDFHRPIQAAWAATIPGAWRDGDRGVRYRAADPVEAFRAFVSLMRLGSSIG